MKSKILFPTIIIALLLIVQAKSQDRSAGDQTAIKTSILEANNIKVEVFNYGALTKANSQAGDLIWNGLGYMYEFGPLLAAKVLNENNEEILIVDDASILPQRGSYSQDGTQKWGWLPQNGFADQDQPNIATLRAGDTNGDGKPDSWPESWYDSATTSYKWPYYNAQEPLDEAYYVIDDYTNEGYVGNSPYYPFPEDHSKRGLGVKMEVWVSQFGGILRDALLVRYKITNTSEKDLIGLRFGIFEDSHIGGATDFADDIVKYIDENGISADRLYTRNTIYSYDLDMMGVGGKEPGYLGFKILNSPSGNNISSLQIQPWTASLPHVPKNNSLMWEWLTGPKDTITGGQPGDNVILFGPEAFDLAAGETKDIIISTFLSENFSELLNSSEQIEFGYNWPNISSVPGSKGGNDNYKIELVPFSGSINGKVPISWNYLGNDPTAKVQIEYSSNRGKEWRLLKADHPAEEVYSWNTELFKDGVNYLLRIVAYNPADKSYNYFAVIDGKFTIDNPENAQPELEIVSNMENEIFTASPIRINILAEDADNNDLLVRLEYSYAKEGPFKSIHNFSGQPGEYEYYWDIENLPNSSTYHLRATLSDGSLDSAITTESFEINYAAGYSTINNINHLSGNATPEFFIQITNAIEATDDEYELIFNIGNDKTLDLKNITTNTLIFDDYPLENNLSTPNFDGKKLQIKDFETDINFDKTSFTRSELDATLTIYSPPTIGNPRIKIPNDWNIIFNDMDKSGGNYLYPADTIMTQLGGIEVIVPFYIYNATEQERADALIYVFSGTPNLSAWSPNQPIILRPQDPIGATTAYELRFNFANYIPHAEDTLKIITNKALTSEDVFRFKIDTSGIIASVHDVPPISDYNLYQNYPNPFNPGTNIRFRISKQETVSLKVYDVLGNEILTLINEVKTPGEYEASFDGSSLSSGVYFYVLRAGDFVQSKKMILLK